jgi:hypothetical protein
MLKNVDLGLGKESQKKRRITYFDPDSIATLTLKGKRDPPATQRPLFGATIDGLAGA